MIDPKTISNTKRERFRSLWKLYWKLREESQDLPVMNTVRRQARNLQWALQQIGAPIYDARGDLLPAATYSSHWFPDLDDGRDARPGPQPPKT